MYERIIACIPPNPRRVGYIDPIHGPLYMGSHIHQHYVSTMCHLYIFLTCSQEMEAVLRGPRNADGSDDVLVTSYC